MRESAGERMRIVVCATCAPETGGAGAERFLASLREALDRDGLGDAVALAPVDCMGACAEPVALALQGEGRASYLFAGVSPMDDLTDIVGTCRHYLSLPDGWIVDARPCGRLRHCLKGRIPALPGD
jgi:predicted metal-binding protein